jgi:hypothetical protein
LLLGKVPKSFNQSTGPKDGKNQPGDEDSDLYSLHYFVHLACEGQTVALDMLHAPEQFWVDRSTTWEWMVEHRDRFYTRNLQAFVGYARRQAAKYGVKGSRLAEVCAVRDFLFEILHPDEDDVLKGRCLDVMTDHGKMRLQEVWDRLPFGEHVKAVTGERGELLLDVCGKKFNAEAPLGEVYRPVFMFAMRYGKRAEEARRNEGVDWKAVSHALRAAYQMQELLRYQTITFPRPEAEVLKQVKRGELDYLTVVAPMLEEQMAVAEELAQQSDLPETVDRAFWEGWLVNEVACHLRRRL